MIKTQVHDLANKVLPVQPTPWDPAALSVPGRNGSLALPGQTRFGCSASGPPTEHSTPCLKGIKVAMNLPDTHFPASIGGSGARKKKLFSHTNDAFIPSVGTKVNSSHWCLQFLNFLTAI